MGGLTEGRRKSTILLPWNEKMDPRKEFRCFVPPVTDKEAMRLTAVSQYRWHEPFAGRGSLDAEKLLEGIGTVLREVLKHAGQVGILNELKRFGFTFDVAVMEKDVQLIEVNPFGAMSGCGSCLFQWLRDAYLIYGLEEDVEVRIAE